MTPPPTPVSVDVALDRIVAGARIVAAPGCAAPTTLLAGLDRLADERAGLHLYTGIQLDDQPFLPAVARGRLGFSTWHVTSQSRDLVADGRASHLPLRLSDVPSALGRLAPDVALLRVSPPDADGLVSLGASASYSHEAVDLADVVLAEVDPRVPRVRGMTTVPVARFSALVDSARPTPAYRAGTLDGTAARVAARVLDLLPSAPTLQLGIGQVPEALGAALLAAGTASLRFIGMGTDGMVDLAEAGQLGESGGEVAPITAVELMGTSRLLRFADDNPAIGLYPSRLAHDPSWLAAHFGRIVSVNSAVEIDLLGQVNAEMVGGRQISGVGGSTDYVDAARASSDGLSIVALPAATRGGRISRIVPTLGPGVATTIPRHAYHVVVTEHGVADLRGLDVPQRAAALIAVAAPEHRDALGQAWADSAAVAGGRVT